MSLVNSSFHLAIISSNKFSGTSLQYEDESILPKQRLSSHLKYDRSGDVPVILVPQPSDDPNDPLVRNPHSLYNVRGY